MSGRLKDRVAYVTGGGKGIGRGIALSLAAEGAAVVVADIDRDAADGVVAEIRGQGGRAIATGTDVMRWDDALALVTLCESEFGHLDIAVHGAGVISVSPVTEMAEAEWDRVMGINIKGVFLGCKAAVPAMRRNGFGRIINIASISGKDGYQGLAHYSASKYAVLGFTNSLAKEVAREGITANSICPGVVKTAMWDILADGYREGDETREQSWQRQVLAFVPQGRPQTVEEVGDLAVYLALAPSVTGQAINIDGGLTSH